ncbi:MAG: hypothetical protein QW328_09980 [Nitrososphaerota archaeon]
MFLGASILRLVLAASAVSLFFGVLTYSYKYTYEQGYNAGVLEASSSCQQAIIKARQQAAQARKQADDLAKKLRDEATSIIKEKEASKVIARDAITEIRRGASDSGCVLNETLPEWAKKINELRGN